MASRMSISWPVQSFSTILIRPLLSAAEAGPASDSATIIDAESSHLFNRIRILAIVSSLQRLASGLRTGANHRSPVVASSRAGDKTGKLTRSGETSPSTGGGDFFLIHELTGLSYPLLTPTIFTRNVTLSPAVRIRER